MIFEHTRVQVVFATSLPERPHPYNQTLWPDHCKQQTKGIELVNIVLTNEACLNVRMCVICFNQGQNCIPTCQSQSLKMC